MTSPLTAELMRELRAAEERHDQETALALAVQIHALIHGEKIVKKSSCAQVELCERVA